MPKGHRVPYFTLCSFFFWRGVGLRAALRGGELSPAEERGEEAVDGRRRGGRPGAGGRGRGAGEKSLDSRRRDLRSVRPFSRRHFYRRLTFSTSTRARARARATHPPRLSPDLSTQERRHVFASSPSSQRPRGLPAPRPTPTTFRPRKSRQDFPVLEVGHPPRERHSPRLPGTRGTSPPQTSDAQPKGTRTFTPTRCWHPPRTRPLPPRTRPASPEPGPSRPHPAPAPPLKPGPTARRGPRAPAARAQLVHRRRPPPRGPRPARPAPSACAAIPSPPVLPVLPLARAPAG